MATFERNKFIYTADDEEPNCMICDHCDDDPKLYCYKGCGPEKYWSNYIRTITMSKLLEDRRSDI